MTTVKRAAALMVLNGAMKFSDVLAAVSRWAARADAKTLEGVDVLSVKLGLSDHDVTERWLRS